MAIDKSFMQWCLGRLQPYRDVAPDKLAAERDAISRQEEHNRNYSDFLNTAVLPAVETLVGQLTRARVVHRVSTWGNQLSIKIHLAWRWGELVIGQNHEDAITFDHHIITEGEKPGEERAEDHSHHYDLHDPLPAIVAEQELIFFLSRLAQDLVHDGPAELPPGA